MEKEIQIIQDLFIPVLQKDVRFDASKCDNTFWEEIVQEFIVYQQDSKPFYATIYGLELAEPMKVIHKLENLQHSFLDQLAEENVLGYSSVSIVKLEHDNPFFNERVQFYKNLEKAIILSERKRIKSELPSMYDKYTFELDEKQLAQAIANRERKALRDKMKLWDKELLAEKEEEQVIELYANKTITKTLPLMPYIKYAIAACLVIGLGFWFELYINTTKIQTFGSSDRDTENVENYEIEDSNSLELPNPVLVDATNVSKDTNALVNEGMGYTSSNNKIKLVSINNTERIVSIKNAIDAYQKFIQKELLTVSGADPKNKKIRIEVEKNIDSLAKELTELQKKQNTYLFDGKKLTLYDIPSDNITLLAFENKFYVKNKNDFYVLTIANEPQQFSKVIDDALKENLEKILFDNGKFE
ncbi:hypothetical protein [Cloacibacterium sp.]|uniref:hypothetical protein n=1 Tax=Cloacibacterium sp. TaxID=1913682 RepID=UPI0035B00954